MRRVTVLLTAITLTLGSVAPASAQEGSIGVVDTSTGEWYLREGATGETTSFSYGSPGDTPFVGDWDCDGDETPGLYRQSDGFVYLRNSSTTGVADIRFFFGNPGDIPLAGDFDGDGCDTVGVYRPAEGKVYLVNRLGPDEAAASEDSYFFGDPGDKAFVGDFDGDGIDEVGLHRESTGLVYLRFTHSQGVADASFFFGNPGDRLVAAEWAGRGAPGPESVGAFRPAGCTSYLRYSNTQGVADEMLAYGLRSGVPVAGEFGALPGGGTPPSCPPCPPDPFTNSRVASLEDRYPGQTFTAHVYDTRTGCEFSMNPASRQSTASVFKVMVMAGTLYEAQSEMRSLSEWETSQLAPMIRESANNPVRALWNHFGGSPWFRLQAELFGLAQTTTVGDNESGWGRTTTSAHDQVDLIRQVILGEWGPLDAGSRDHAWSLMTSVVPDQTWGVTAGVPPGWTVGQKNGFAGGVANSVGFIRHPDGADGYAIAILTSGWPAWARGVPTVNEIAGWVSESLTQ
ncbi:MAG TPA: serine hydrolase [Acidimicrobiia bacterium]